MAAEPRSPSAGLDGGATDAAREGERGARLEPVFKEELRNAGLGDHGCEHYRRRCRLVAPCCKEVVDCRHCHNEKQAAGEDFKEHHELPRHEVQEVSCRLCSTMQKVQQFCCNCGVCMGQYFCEQCKFFDDDTSKEQFHCDKCGICRVGGKDKFFHCDSCGCCYSTALEGNHRCVEAAMNHNCPVCFEYLFDSLQQTNVLKRCGHTIHSHCLDVLLEQHSRFPSCPVCLKSIGDLTRCWELLDEEVASTPMPQEYQDLQVDIVCNDCEISSRLHYHVVGLKCSQCGSYNTTRK